MSEIEYLAQANAYLQERSRRALAARMPRRLLIRAGTLAALGGSSALSALIAACARGAARETLAAGQKLEEGAYKYSPYPLVEKYNWRNLPWGGTPYVGGDVREPRAPSSNYTVWSNSLSGTGMVFSQLTHVRFGEGAYMDRLEFEGDLARDYKAAPDLSYWDFFLRRGASFHDIPPVNGREVTADDVKFSLDRYKDASLWSAPVSFIDRVEVLDRYSVRLHMKKPVLFVPQVLAQPYYSIVAPEHAEGNAEYFKTTPIGSGPFKVIYSQDREKWDLVKHPEWHFSDVRYPGTRLPFIDRVTGHYFADTNARVTAFRTGQIDWSMADKKVLDDVLATTPDIVVQAYITSPTAGGMRWFYLQQRPGSPLSDLRVRRAISLSIDREKIINAWELGAGAWGSPIGYDKTGYDAPHTRDYYERFWQRYDPQQAKALLAEAGYPDGLEVEVLRSPAQTEDYFPLFEPMMAASGIRLKFNRQETSVVTSMRTKGEFAGIAVGSNVASYGPPIVAAAQFSRNAPTNYSGVDDPALDSMIQEAYYAVDADRQVRLMREIDEHVMDRVYTLSGWANFTIFMFRPWLHNVASTIDPWFSGWGSWSLALAWLDDKAAGSRGGTKSV